MATAAILANTAIAIPQSFFIAIRLKFGVVEDVKDLQDMLTANRSSNSFFKTLL